MTTAVIEDDGGPIDRRPWALSPSPGLRAEARPRELHPPMMNLGYWGDGAVTAREAQVTLVRRMAERLPDLRGQRVLDAGCGAGGHSNVLALECGADVDAIDILPERIELGRDFAAAHGIGDRLRFQIADATALPFEDGSFDAVFSLEAAHSFSDKTRFAHEAFRVLRPGEASCWAT